MTEKERLNEKHESSKLAEYMSLSSDPRPHPLCHCHAIVAGNHSESVALRAILAWLAMRIDDPRNGCWLPANTAARDKMPQWLKKAIPHSRVHRRSYYRWLEDRINLATTTSLELLTSELKMIRTRLQTGAIPDEILLELGYEVRMI